MQEKNSCATKKNLAVTKKKKCFVILHQENISLNVVNKHLELTLNIQRSIFGYRSSDTNILKNDEIELLLGLFLST